MYSTQNGQGMCAHVPPCPTAQDADHDAARIIVDHHEQGWIQLCNGVIVFDDTSELHPDRRSEAPHRPAPMSHWRVSA